MRRPALLLLALCLLAAGCQTAVPAPAPPPATATVPLAVPPATPTILPALPTATSRPPTSLATATPGPAGQTPAATPSARMPLVIAAAAGPVEMQAELALTPQQRELGLMFRRSLTDGEGMLFVFPADTTGAFWMQNTLVALSIAWIAADGTILGLDDMAPRTEDLHYPPQAYRYTLEVPLGFYARRGVKAGDKIGYLEGGSQQPLSQLPQVAQAR